ncbi:MAG: hypothetical protein HUU21_13120 [Polyangiaceae bacterium]|nr:hypothetical protein [Polyangiaceae bacterium]
MLSPKAFHHPSRRSALLRAFALFVAGLFALLFSACLSPTLPLPPPDVNSMQQAQASGTWTISGTCLTGAIVTVFNERTGRGAVVEDRDNTGFFSVTIEADPCDLAWAKQEEGQDTSSRNTFVIQKKSQDLVEDPNACK